MNKTRSCLAIGLVAAFSAAPVMPAEPDDTAERVKACAAIAEAAERFACYETLGQEALAAEPAQPVETPSAPPGAPVAAAATTAAATAASVPDTSAPTNVPVGGESSPEEYRVAVSSCTVTKAGDLYLLLANGETWKRTGGQRIRENDCSFTATLTKDFFGYKMALDDGKGTVRVKRVK